MNHKSTWLAYLGAIGSSLASALCCIGPLIVFTFGLGGAWASTASIFAPYRNYLIVIVAASLGYAFYRLYIIPPKCTEGEDCPHPKTIRLQRIIFWIITALAILLLTFPWYVHIFY